MANAAMSSARCPQAVSTVDAFLAVARRVLTKRPMRRALATLIIITCAAALGLAQNSEPSNEQPALPTAPEPQAAPAPAQPATVTIPSGTRFALVLTHPISSKTVHRGDDIYAQTTAPVAIGDQVVIPAGTYVQGVVEKLSRDDSRGEIQLQSASVIFPDGYIAHVGGPLQVESDEGTAWANPSGGTRAGAIIAPAAGLGIGAAIGAAAHTTHSSTLAGQVITSSTAKGLAIGSIVGLAAGAAVAIVVLTHSHQFFVDVGSPMQMTLQQPMILAQNRVDDANREAQVHPPAITPAAPRPIPVYYPPTFPANHGTCYTPGTPGTPPTVIPGTPGPNGIPGPPTVIPGTPAIPGSPYPCP